MRGMRNKKRYRVVVATAIGPYHKTKGLKGQDQFAYKQQKGRLVALVSDGAGSAKYGKIGAKYVCDKLAEVLIKADFKQIKQEIVDALERTRDELIMHRLNKQKNENGLINFAATVVGVVCQNGRGLFFHIGDGAGVALKKSDSTFVISEPENGIFSSETFFYTMDDWKDSLRFTSFEGADSLFLMTDGVTGFAFKKDFEMLEKGFLPPIDAFLKNEKSAKKASRALKNTLDTPKARSLSGDDKTLMWVSLK
ncbi:MAG TPA: hypothetical protein DIC64_02850 [Alphaproteobacteria bacterium]|nr:hypothetical protein [Alphaproteobacteria bacterium]